MSRFRIAAALAAVTATVVMVLALPITPAGAHGATGTLGLEATPGAAPLTVRVRALLEYSNDREVAPGATVTVEGRQASGQTVGPQALADQGRGLYEATLTLPGDGAWTFTVTAVDPAATGQVSLTLSTASGTSPATAAGDVRTSSDDATAADQADRDSTATTATETTDDGVSVVVIVGIILVVGIAIGTAAAFARRRTPR